MEQVLILVGGLLLLLHFAVLLRRLRIGCSMSVELPSSHASDQSSVSSSLMLRQPFSLTLQVLDFLHSRLRSHQHPRLSGAVWNFLVTLSFVTQKIGR